MSNKNISQYTELLAPSSDDFLLIWDNTLGITYKVNVNTLLNSPGTQSNVFDDIYIRHKAYISGIIGGSTGTNLITGFAPGILAGQSNRAVRDYSSILNGVANLASGDSSVVAGENNQVFGYLGACLGGQLHFLEPEGAGIIAGHNNRIIGTLSLYSTILGGSNNIITGNAYNSAVIAGGTNRIHGAYSTIAGGLGNRLTGDYSFIGGGRRNISSGIYSFIGGGLDNITYSEKTTIAGGNANLTSGIYSFIGGGNTNTTDGTSSSVVGGNTNIAKGIYCFVGGGNSNAVRSDSVFGNSSIVGGENNQVIGAYAAILGGDINKVSGTNAVVIGGSSNVSSGNYSFTMGNQCEAFENGAVMFGDSTAVTKRSYGQDSFTLNYSGGVWVTGGGLNARRGFNLYPTGVTPTSSTPGRSGDFAVKDNYLYVYTGDPNDTNRNWGRVALSTMDGSPPSVVSNDSVSVYPWGDEYYVTNTFANVAHTGPAAQDFSLTIPAGNATYVMDCIFGVQKGSLCNTIFYKLENTSDSRMIPNSSGFLKLPTTDAHSQVSIKVISGFNFATSKIMTLQVYTDIDIAGEVGGHELKIRPTGSSMHLMKIR